MQRHCLKQLYRAAVSFQTSNRLALPLQLKVFSRRFKHRQLLIPAYLLQLNPLQQEDSYPHLNLLLPQEMELILVSLRRRQQLLFLMKEEVSSRRFNHRLRTQARLKHPSQLHQASSPTHRSSLQSPQVQDFSQISLPPPLKVQGFSLNNLHRTQSVLVSSQRFNRQQQAPKVSSATSYNLRQILRHQTVT